MLKFDLQFLYLTSASPILVFWPVLESPSLLFMSHYFPLDIMQTAAERLSTSSTESNDWKSQETTMARDSETLSSHSKELRDSKSDTDPSLLESKSHELESSLAPEFNNTTDEAELGKLMGDDGEKLLDLIDDIRKIDSLRNEEIYIPQIVVIGETSSGKSSVLQALSRLPFPVAVDLCTRFVTETTIRRCGLSEKPGYKIEVRMDGLGASQDPPFPSKSFESENWVEVYQHLREDINDAFEKMGPNQLPPFDTPGKVRRGFGEGNLRTDQAPKLQRHRLQVTVRKPNQAHFSIVDIPGLVSSGMTTDIQISEELARQYVKNEEAIVLAVTPAISVIENQKWLNLVTEENALHRTIGVVTKTDRIEKVNHELIFNRLRNQPGSEHHLKLGWFAVRNRSSEEVMDGKSFEERDRKEAEFFETDEWQKATLRFPAWDSIDPNILGIQNLKHTLQDHLYKRVKTNLPRLRAKMQSLETQYTNKLQSMGDPREEAQDQRIYLSDIQTIYEAEVERSLHGDYRFLNDEDHPSKLRLHIKRFNDKFESSIRTDALKYHWQISDQDDETKGGGILTWIDHTWNAHRGSETQHDAPRSLKKELVKQQTESWEKRTRSYIRWVENAIKACNDDLFLFACKDSSLRHKIRKKLAERERKVFECAEAELRSILQDRDYIDSWNSQLQIVLNQCQEARLERQVQAQLERQKLASASASSTELSRDEVAKRQTFYNNNKRVYEVHDWLCAYWSVAYPRFVDNVIIQVVERHLMGSKGPLSLFSRNWILQLKDDELEYLVGENEVTRERRRDLKERLEGLRNALELADEVIRED